MSNKWLMSCIFVDNDVFKVVNKIYVKKVVNMVYIFVVNDDTSQFLC